MEWTSMGGICRLVAAWVRVEAAAWARAPGSGTTHAQSTVRLYTPTHWRSCCIHAKGRASAFAAVAADAVQGAYEIVHLIREEHLLERAE